MTAADERRLEDFKVEIRRRFPREWGLEAFKPEDLFVVWWVFAQLTAEDIEAAKASATEPPDGGVDAVHVDHDGSTVYLVQGKFHDTLTKHDSEEDLNDLSKWAKRLTSPEEEFLAAIGDLAPKSREKLKEARRFVKDRRYRLRLHFISTGRASAASLRNQPPALTYWDGHHVIRAFEDFGSGVRPIQELSLAIAENFAESTSSSRAPAIQLGVYLVSGREIRKSVEAHPDRLFSRNVRGFLGDSTEVARKIRKTILEAPEQFRYLNNGLTIVCDRSVLVREGGKQQLTLSNPQVVNGQQTSWVVSKVSAAEAARIEILTKVIAVDRNRVHGSEYDRIVRHVVEATNRQNAINLADLRSNDQLQVDLQRALRRLQHHYARKKEAKADTRLAAGGDPYVTREDLVDSVGACLWESASHRLTKARFFEDPYYESVFDPDQAERSLVCHYLWKVLNARLKGRRVDQRRAQGRWLAAYALWQIAEPDLILRSRRFISYGRSARPPVALRSSHEALVDAIADSVQSYFDKEAPKVGLAQDPTQFFKRQDLYPGLEVFWRSRDGAPTKKLVESRYRKFIDELGLDQP